MRTIKVNALTQPGHIDFSPQLISFILGIYYLLDIHVGVDINLCVHCDHFYCSFFLYCCSKPTHMNAFADFYCKPAISSNEDLFSAHLLIKQDSQCAALFAHLFLLYKCVWRWHIP